MFLSLHRIDWVSLNPALDSRDTRKHMVLSCGYTWPLYFYKYFRISSICKYPQNIIGLWIGLYWISLQFKNYLIVVVSSHFWTCMTLHFHTAPQPWWPLQTKQWKILHQPRRPDVCTPISVLPPLTLNLCPHSTHPSLQSNSVICPACTVGLSYASGQRGVPFCPCHLAPYLVFMATRNATCLQLVISPSNSGSL